MSKIKLVNIPLALNLTIQNIAKQCKYIMVKYINLAFLIIQNFAISTLQQFYIGVKKVFCSKNK